MSDHYKTLLLEERKRRVREILKRDPTLTIEVLKERTGMSRETIGRIKAELKAEKEQTK
jgi:DeoR/GlpR family transcriptional regulator of sugar metabolism